MKIIVTIAVILAVLTLYFIVNAEKSILIKGSEVFPAGTDIAKLVINKAKEVASKIGSGNILQVSNSDSVVETIKAGASKLIPKIFNKAGGLIKNSVEDKIIETFCPVK